VSEFDHFAFLREPAFIPSRDDVFDDSESDTAVADAPPTSGREGLPSNYRMRHDKHYVDLITSRAAAAPVELVAVKDIDGARPCDPRALGPLVESILSFGILQPLLVRRRRGRYELIAGSKRLAAAIAGGLTEVPCLLREADDERALALAKAENLRVELDDAPGDDAVARAGLPARAAREIVDSLVTIESCLNLFLDRERPLRERVAASLVRAEAHRALWLAEACSLLGAEPSLAKKPLSPASLIERTLQRLEAEGRLANVEMTLTIDEPMGKLLADERLISAALTGAAGAMLGLLQGAGGATLQIHVSIHPATRLLAFQFSQDLVAAPLTRLPAWDDPSMPDWPGGLGASLGLAVASRVMQIHGGQVEIGPGPRCGCTVTLTVPAGD
jgi:ParB-like chromosome segregation protein Spo0J